MHYEEAAPPPQARRNPTVHGRQLVRQIPAERTSDAGFERARSALSSEANSIAWQQKDSRQASINFQYFDPLREGLNSVVEKLVQGIALAGAPDLLVISSDAEDEPKRMIT